MRGCKCLLRRGAATLFALILAVGGVGGGGSAEAGGLVSGEPEFRVNTYTTGLQYGPRVAADPAGGFVVVWQSRGGAVPQDGSGSGIFGQRYNAGGTRLGTEFRVNSYTTGTQYESAVVTARDGGFVVSWAGTGPSGREGAFARRFAADGVAVGPETQLDAATPERVSRARAAALDDGGFVFAWLRQGTVAGVRTDGRLENAVAFDEAVDEVTNLAVTGAPNGEFVVVWSSYEYTRSGCCAEGGVGTVYGRRFDGDGAPGSRFRVNSDRADPTGYGFYADGVGSLVLASNANGGFVVAHDSYVPAYFYNTDEVVDGWAIGTTVELFEGLTSQGSTPASAQVAGAYGGTIGLDVAATPGGTYVVVWSDRATSPSAVAPALPDTDGSAVFARVFDCNGVGLPEIQINRYTTGEQKSPAIAVTERGDVIVVWASRDGDSRGIVGRRFGLDNSCPLCGDADADGRVTASDALDALRTAVGIGSCSASRCDADASGRITVTDALRILQAASGMAEVELSCAERILNSSK